MINPMSPVPARIKIPSALWEGIRRMGISRAELMTRAKLPIRILQEGTPVSMKQFFGLWHALAEMSDDAGVGLSLSLVLDCGVMPPSFLAAYYARDYRDGLQRVARFKRLCTPETVLLTEHDDRCELELTWIHDGDETVPHTLVDASLAALLELGRRGTGAALVPVAVELRRSACARAVYERYFGCPVQFGASRDCMMLRRADLDRPFLNYNAELLEILVPTLESRLENQTQKTSLSEQVQWILRRRLTAGRPDIRSVAGELAMSERSLQRRLTEEGLSFQALLSKTRHQLAVEYLSEVDFSLMEVAYMLGYEDQNSFFRAFRQWEARTPSEWRLEKRHA